jgi:hypothetical protein
LTRKRSVRGAETGPNARTAGFRKACERNGTMEIVRGERALKDLLKKVKKLLLKDRTNK